MSHAQESIGIREDAFSRWVWISAVGHAVLLAAFVLTPKPTPRSSLLPAVVRVNLVPAGPVARPAPAPPRPAPEPAPKAVPKPPPPPPPPPAPKKVVLPTEPTRTAEPKPKVARPRPEPRKAPEPAPQPEETYEDVLASLRQEAGENAPQPVEVAQAEPLPGAGPGGGGAVGVPISAEEAAWRRRAKLHVHRAWVLAPGFRMQNLETEVRVRLGPGGHVSDLRVVRSSGNPWYDESVERAIRKASPLPRPIEPGEWTFLFRPEDLLR